MFFSKNTTDPAEKENRLYGKAETAFAWVCLLIGYAFCRAFPLFNRPLGSFLWILGTYVATTVVLKIKKAPLTGRSALSFFSGLTVAVSMLFSANTVLHFFAIVFCIFAYIYYLYTAFGNRTDNKWNDWFLLDYFKALFIAPFLSLKAFFRHIFNGNGKQNGKEWGKGFIGLSIAAVPTLIIILLLSYDDGFVSLLTRILDFGFSDVFSHLCSLLFGLLPAILIFSLFTSSAEQKCKTLYTKEQCQKAGEVAQIAPVITVVSAVLPILAVYILFFISQWKYYWSAFTGHLPEAVSYAEYARKGFFQLCAVSVINIAIIAVIGLFMRRTEKGAKWTQKILNIVIALFTLVLIATAIAKMALYIDVYGLTPKRVYATWFMIVLALLFVLTILKQFVKKLPLIACGATLFVVAFSLLCFVNTDRQIAEYNVDRYLEKSISDFDVQATRELGDAAIPAMVRLVTQLDREYGTDLVHYHTQQDKMPKMTYLKYRDTCYALYQMAAQRQDSEVWEITLPRLKADSALKQTGIADNLDEWRQTYYRDEYDREYDNL